MIVVYVIGMNYIFNMLAGYHDNNFPAISRSTIVCSHDNAMFIKTTYGDYINIDDSGHDDYVLVRSDHTERIFLRPDYVVYDKDRVFPEIDNYDCEKIPIIMGTKFSIYYQLQKHIAKINNQLDSRIPELESRIISLISELESATNEVNRLMSDNADLRNKLQQIINLI